MTKCGTVFGKICLKKKKNAISMWKMMTNTQRNTKNNSVLISYWMYILTNLMIMSIKELRGVLLLKRDMWYVEQYLQSVY